MNEPTTTNLTAEEFYRNKIREHYNKPGEFALSCTEINAEKAMRWAYEFSQQQNASLLNDLSKSEETIEKLVPDIAPCEKCGTGMSEHNLTKIGNDFICSKCIEAIIPKSAITEWTEVKQKYLEHQIDNYDKGYLALFDWLEKNYIGIDKHLEPEKKYTQCPECFNSDKNCEWCNGDGLIEMN